MASSCIADNGWFCVEYLQRSGATLWAATVEHLELTVGSMVAAIVLAVPLAIIAGRSTRLQTAMLSVASAIYTIPSLALITALWPIFGLTPLTVGTALTLYALLVVLRGLIVGLESVPADVVESATGMGVGPIRLLLTVQLPLSLPVALAGVRVATVSTVGLVTIGALLGHGGLGTVILDGFISNFFHAQIMWATLGCVLIAVVFDLALLGVQKVMTPWQRSTRERSRAHRRLPQAARGAQTTPTAYDTRAAPAIAAAEQV